VHGFASFDPDLEVAGVILNRVGSPGHAALIREAMTGSIPVLGTLPRTPEIVVQERHLGLHLPQEAGADHVERTADLVDAHVDLDQILRLTRTERRRVAKVTADPPARARLAVARDEAFCFYYEDNFALLRQAGAELVEFSPLRDPLPADVEGIYIGGGYPELHAAALAGNAETRAAIRAFAAAGGPVYGECGGLMYLAEELEYEGARHPQCGVLPFSARMRGQLALGYVEVTTTGGLFGAGQVARGHVYHHSEIEGTPDVDCCYSVRTSKGAESSEGYGIRSVLASYAHLHFRSNPSLATAFVDACCAFGRRARAG
jgi:cobyrinic acid a,c-diamide synthase